MSEAFKCPSCPATAFLFVNGTAAYFDHNEQQVVEWQKRNWVGVHLFREKYPNAEIKLFNLPSMEKKDIERVINQIALPEEWLT